MAIAYDLDTNAAAITFPGLAGGLLPDGNYRLTLADGVVFDGAHHSLDGDKDGSAGGAFEAAFYRLGGDANGDRAVDELDRSILDADFGHPAITRADGDLTGDGIVDFADLVLVAQNYDKPQSAAGDVNDDGAADFADLVKIAQNFDKSGRADFDVNGTIDAADRAILEANFGNSLPPIAPAAAMPATAQAPAANMMPTPAQAPAARAPLHAVAHHQRAGQHGGRHRHPGDHQSPTRRSQGPQPSLPGTSKP